MPTDPTRDPHGGFEDGNGVTVVPGDRVEYRSGARRGLLIEAFHDGDANVVFDDGQGPPVVKWRNLCKVPAWASPHGVPPVRESADSERADVGVAGEAARQFCKLCGTTGMPGEPVCQTADEALRITAERLFGCPWLSDADRAALRSQPAPSFQDRNDTLTARLKAIRAAGWSVAVHNDYRLAGEAHTFWLVTHADGRWFKGEGRTDAEALNQIAVATHAENASVQPAPSQAAADVLVERPVPDDGYRLADLDKLIAPSRAFLGPGQDTFPTSATDAHLHTQERGDGE